MRHARVLPAQKADSRPETRDERNKIKGEMMHMLGLIAAVVMPLWNIPLIIRIARRKSSKDISLSWALGILGCMFLMLPSALASPDVIFKAFGIVNAMFFTAVVVQVIRYR